MPGPTTLVLRRQDNQHVCRHHQWRGDSGGPYGEHYPGWSGGLTLINDTDPAGDACSSKTAQVQMTSKNIGDLLDPPISPGVRLWVASTCKP